MDQLLSHLADPDIVVFEQRQYELDPYSPVAAWVAAYTTYVVSDQASGAVRREVAAGADVLVAMTIPARLVACSLRRNLVEHQGLVELVRRLGPVSVRVALCGGLEALVKSRLHDDDLVELLGSPPYSPVRALLTESVDLTADGAEVHLAGVLAAVPDPAVAVLETAELLERFLLTRLDPSQAAAAAETYATTWPQQRYVDADGRRTDHPETPPTDPTAGGCELCLAPAVPVSCIRVARSEGRSCVTLGTHGPATTGDGHGKQQAAEQQPAHRSLQRTAGPQDRAVHPFPRGHHDHRGEGRAPGHERQLVVRSQRQGVIQ